MSIQLIVGEDDFSNYVVSSERTHKICQPVANLELVLAPNLPRTIVTYESVTYYENSIKVFTGYTGGVAKARIPVDVKLTCYDALIKAKDTWLTKEFISYGETVGYWIGKFLRKSDIYGLTGDCNFAVYPGYSWDKMNAMEAITGTLQMCPCQIYCDRDGAPVLATLSRGIPVKTILSPITYERTRSDSWIRNRAVVMGAPGIVADMSRPNPYLPGQLRTAVVATGQIYNESTAGALATRMLDEFENPLDVKIITIPGNPSLWIGDTVHLHEAWSEYNDNCLVTSLVSKYNAHTYEMELTLDEKCINFWGWDSEPAPPTILYAGTWGMGVYRTPDAGVSWIQTNLGNGIYVYDIEVVDEECVWAACRSGVYYTSGAGGNWTKQSMGAPSMFIEEQTEEECQELCDECYIPCYESCIDDGGTPEECASWCSTLCEDECQSCEEEPILESSLYFVGVTTKNSDTSAVYCLAGNFDNKGLWLYFTKDNGLNWHNVRIR